MVGILIADDHTHTRESIRNFIGEVPNWEVCAEASDGREALHYAETLQPNVILLDVTMPTMNGFEAARRIHESSPDVPILMLTLYDEPTLVREWQRFGARGFLPKPHIRSGLIQAISTLLRGESHFP